MSETTTAESTLENQDAVVALLILNETPDLQADDIVRLMGDTWQISIKKSEKNTEETLIFSHPHYTFALALVDMPIPGEEIQKAANLSYAWEDATEAIKKHKAHIIITLMGEIKDMVNAYLAFTKFATVVMKATGSEGIYMGNQGLLLPRTFFTEVTEYVREQALPLYNWIYFGFKMDENGISAYTYGLQEFGFCEMEMLESHKPFQEIQEFMYETCHYVLESRVELKEGDTVSLGPKQKLKVSISNGHFLPGETIKLGL